MRKQIIIKEIELGNSQTITQFLDGAEWHFLLYGSRKNINFVGNEGQRKGRYFCEQRKFGSGVRDGVAYIYTSCGEKMTNCCKEGYPSMGYPSFDSFVDE